MPRIDSSLPNVHRPAIPSFREATKRSPEGTANALLPIAHALGAGFVTFCGVGLISIGVHWPVRVALIGAGIVMLAVMCLSGWWMVKNEVLWSVEKILGDDVNRDGIIGQPTTQVHFELPTGPNSLRFGRVNLDPELLIAWCQAAVNQQSLAYAAWEQRFATPGAGDGRAKYQDFRSWLIQEGFAAEAGSNIGLKINWRNPDAVAFISGFANCQLGDGTPLLNGDARFAAPHTATHTGTQHQEWDDDQE